MTQPTKNSIPKWTENYLDLDENKGQWSLARVHTHFLALVVGTVAFRAALGLPLIEELVVDKECTS
jgi:hypothetical protein